MATKSSQDSEKKHHSGRFDALRSLMYVAVFGCLLILGYGLRFGREKLEFLSISSVGIMAAGAALLTGGLLGFLFGVPHTKSDAGGAEKKPGDGTDQSKSAAPNSPGYRPNTSLEQISDWLTKIIVGVGLVDIKQIPPELAKIARFVAKGLGGSGDSAEALAITLLIYFSVCGFVFGFLWARLYLPKWFREADEMQALGEKIDQLEKQPQADAYALALVQRLLEPGTNDAPIPQEEANEAIQAASPTVKVQIFTQAEKVSDNKEASDYQARLEGVITVLRGLIATDNKNIYHRNHYELSVAYYRREPPDYAAAVEEATKAIEIRDRLGKKGWKHHEFHRARCLIKQIPEADRKKPSDPQLQERILKDLRAAKTQGDKWPKWYKDQESVQNWLAVNHIDPATLKPS